MIIRNGGKPPMLVGEKPQVRIGRLLAIVRNLHHHQL
jgi:hypothetical protein